MSRPFKKLLFPSLGRAFWGLMMMVCSLGIFCLIRTFPKFDLHPNLAGAVFMGILGVLLLVAEFYSLADRRLNRRPAPPYYQLSRSQSPVLELDSEGSYQDCLRFLNELRNEFGAEFSEHLEAGPRPDSDKEKGYWNISLAGQDFLLMRVRGDGMCLWGPKPPVEQAHLLKLAQFVNAREYVTWQEKLRRSAWRN